MQIIILEYEKRPEKKTTKKKEKKKKQINKWIKRKQQWKKAYNIGEPEMSQLYLLIISPVCIWGPGGSHLLVDV